MMSMRRRYVASTSLRRHVPAGNLAPPLAPQNSKPWPPNTLNLPTPMLLIPIRTKSNDVMAIIRWMIGLQNCKDGIAEKFDLVPKNGKICKSRVRAYCAGNMCGWGLFGHFFSLVYHFSFLSPSLWETAR